MQLTSEFSIGGIEIHIKNRRKASLQLDLFFSCIVECGTSFNLKLIFELPVFTEKRNIFSFIFFVICIDEDVSLLNVELLLILTLILNYQY